ncbi:hypothetical protein WBP07_29920 [Novosphingobium sp. BL-8A]|uniref:hypothetical protein n=1 Tax=Novosphingobium sp. BL-8A TaxID=3127639 RepID=UPI0037581AFD
MSFSETKCPWETAANDLQECVTLLDYMDNYEVPFATASEEALFLRTLQLSVELLESARSDQLAEAGIDLSRICCKQFAEILEDWDTEHTDTASSFERGVRPLRAQRRNSAEGRPARLSSDIHVSCSLRYVFSYR